MFSQSELARIEDMLDSCWRIAMYTAGLDRRLFFLTKVVHDAVLWNLLIIGESANHLPESVSDSFPDIPWRQLVGLRNRLAHDYNTLDEDTLWEIVSNGVPQLDLQLQNLLGQYEANGLQDG